MVIFTDGGNGEDGKQPFVLDLKNEYKAILPEVPSDVSVTHLFIAYIFE